MFGIIPEQRDYSGEVTIQVESVRGIVARGTNLNYLVFSLSREEASEVRVKFTVQKGQEKERLILHLARGF